MSPPLDPRLEAVLRQADELPSLPAVAVEVLRRCRAEETTLDDLARALSADPALAARLLRFANSSLYGSGEEVRTLQRATLVLGLKTVQLMALSFSLVTVVPRAGPAAFDYARYWRRSLVRAVSARALAGHVGLAAQDEAFLAGLLGEIGQVVLVRCLPAEYAPVLAAAAREERGWPGLALERRLLGFDSADVGLVLMRAWQLPGVLQQALEHAADPEGLPREAPAEIGQLVRVLALAGHVTDFLTLAAGARGLERVHTSARHWFGLDEAQVAKLLAALDGPIRETAGLLELELPEGRTVARVLEEARAELAQRSRGEVRAGESLDPAGPPELAADPARSGASPGRADEAAFQHALAREVRARIGGDLARPLGLLLVEIDRFAALPGDETRVAAEHALGDALARLTRKQDLAARLAPGRFAVLLGDATPFGQRALAERLRKELEQLAPGTSSGERGISVSVGGACLAAVKHASDGDALRRVVERLLVRAQERGPGESEVHAAPLQGR